MCGRFTLTADGQVIQQSLGLEDVPQGLKPRYNIAPSQPVSVVTGDEPNKLNFFTWGLIPSWSKDPSIGNRLINARSETAHEKPSFRAAMKYRRCLIPSDGWYEWRKTGKSKTPMFLHMPNFEVFAFAGLWEQWHAPDGSEVLSCTILTTSATDELSDIHHRMPVIIRSDDYDLWLNDGNNPTARETLFKSYTHKPIETYPVSTLVNKPVNDSPQNIVPLEDGGNEQMTLL